MWALARAVAVLALAGATASAKEACTPGDGHILARACFSNDEPNPRYGHDVLGETPEWSALRLYWGDKAPKGLTGGQTRTEFKLASGIFEDIAPRIGQGDTDPFPEIVVVESQAGQGARVVVIDLSDQGVSAIPGPFIGMQNRWLAPVAFADLDDDGVVELAYVDRPHLAKKLRIFELKDRRLTQVAEHDGVTNHRIGEPFISGGLRTCAGTPEMVLATGNWRGLVAIRFDGSAVTQRDLGPFKDPQSFAAAMGCNALP